MSLDWSKAQEGPDGQLAVALEYEHVRFHVFAHFNGWVVQVSCDGIVRWSDDGAKAAGVESGKRRAEQVYGDDAAAWCCMDMLAELLAGAD